MLEADLANKQILMHLYKAVTNSATKKIRRT